jgi:hypothetical protein
VGTAARTRRRFASIDSAGRNGERAFHASAPVLLARDRTCARRRSCRRRCPRT